MKTFQLKGGGMETVAANMPVRAGNESKTLSRPISGLNTEVKTMTLKETLQHDVIAHMKSGNKLALTTVRNVLGEIGTREKTGKTPIEMDDVQVIALLQKEAIKRRDTARIHIDAGEDSCAAAEIAEAIIIEAYLPAPLTRTDVEVIVNDVVAGLKAEGTELSMRSMGLVMKPVTAKVAGRFDGKAVSELVRAALA